MGCRHLAVPGAQYTQSRNNRNHNYSYRLKVLLDAGRDVIAQAQSGTGKTSMIALALCQILETNKNQYVTHFNLIETIVLDMHSAFSTDIRVLKHVAGCSCI